MTFYFITTNDNKFLEVQSYLKDVREVKQMASEMVEIQDMDPKEIVKMKLGIATKHRKDELIVEDASLHLDCLSGLPGPFIKWFVRILGAEGVYQMAKRLGDVNAEARCTIGYSNGGKVQFFEGSVRGILVLPRGKSSFDWDPIFQSEGKLETFAEMSMEDKNGISHRGNALKKLKGYLEKANQ